MMLNVYENLENIRSILSYSWIIDSIFIWIIVSLVVHHIAISSVSILLHRNNTHWGVRLSRVTKHIMDAIVRVSSPIIPKEWVAAHVQHHAQSDKHPDEDKLRWIWDPHSPQPTIWTKFHIFIKEYTNVNFSKYMGAIDELYKQKKIRGVKPWYIVRTFPMIILWSIYIFVFWYGAAMIMILIQALLWRWTITLVNGMWHSAIEKWTITDDHSVNITLESTSILAKLWNNYFLNFMCAWEQFHGNHHKKMQSADISLWQDWFFDLWYWYIRRLENMWLASNVKT